MKLVGVRSEDTEETVGWMQMNWWLAAATAKRISRKERKLMTHHFRNNARMLTTHLYPYIRDCTICKASKCNNLSVLVKENVPCFIFVSASGDLFKWFVRLFKFRSILLKNISAFSPFHFYVSGTQTVATLTAFSRISLNSRASLQQMFKQCRPMCFACYWDSVCWCHVLPAWMGHNSSFNQGPSVSSHLLLYFLVSQWHTRHHLEFGSHMMKSSHSV